MFALYLELAIDSPTHPETNHSETRHVKRLPSHRLKPHSAKTQSTSTQSDEASTNSEDRPDLCKSYPFAFQRSCFEIVDDDAA